MKQISVITEVEGEGLEALLGENVLLFCMNYIYTGKMVGVNSVFVKLEGAKIVYETGSFSDKNYTDAQNLPTGEWYVQISAIESYGLGK
jgi:hypothetical protein